jgi:hypothetical protein
VPVTGTEAAPGDEAFEDEEPDPEQATTDTSRRAATPARAVRTAALFTSRSFLGRQPRRQDLELVVDAVAVDTQNLATFTSGPALPLSGEHQR